MAAFLKKLGPLHDWRILDYGCGPGGIALVLAQHGAMVVAADRQQHRVETVRQRAKDAGLTGLTAVHVSDASDFAPGSFDLVILNGVLEYLGEGAPDPRGAQCRTLAKLRHLLKPGGLLYVGIENRLYPFYLPRDPHSGLPLTSMAPRWMANLVSYILKRKPFTQYIHTARGLERMHAEAGFSSTRLYIPLGTYQYPVAFAPDNADGATMRQILADGRRAPMTDEYRGRTFGRLPSVKLAMLQSLAALRLLRWFAPGFVAISRR